MPDTASAPIRRRGQTARGTVAGVARDVSGARWVVAASVSLLAFAAATGLYALPDGAAPALVPAVEPEYYVWAWRREEDLSFIDPRRVKVAVWTATIHMDDDGFVVERRTNGITYPSDAEVVGVVRLEITGVPDAAEAPRLADAIIGASRPFRPVEHQVDFDARLSQRSFYRRLLDELRARTGGLQLSITALASWCLHEGWTQGLPVDAMVPMLYRMGGAGDLIRDQLQAGREFPNPACAGQVGYSADEPLAPVDRLRRVFLFHPEPWSESRYNALVERVRICNETAKGCS